MTRRLYQGVPGIADISESLRTISNICHPERQIEDCHPQRHRAERVGVEGPAVALRSFNSARKGVPHVPILGHGITRDADTLHEECGVVAIHNHAHAAHQAYLSLCLQASRPGVGRHPYRHWRAPRQHQRHGPGPRKSSPTMFSPWLPGHMAIEPHALLHHWRLRPPQRAQPIRVDSTKGLIAIAHNSIPRSASAISAHAPGARGRLLFKLRHDSRNHRPGSSLTPAPLRSSTPSPIRSPGLRAHSPSS